MTDRWLSMEEICKYVGASTDTIYRWIEHNGMPASKVGRFWKFKKIKWMHGLKPEVPLELTKNNGNRKFNHDYTTTH